MSAAVPVAPALAPVAAPRPAPRPVSAPAPAWDPSRELRESPVWRPFPSAVVEPVRRRPNWLLPLALIAAAVVVLGVAAVLAVQSLGSRATAVTPTAPPSAAPNRGLPAPVTGSVGRAVTVAGLRLTLVTGAANVQATPQPPLRTGDRYVAVEVLYENPDGRPGAIVDPYDWSLTDDKGAVYGAEPPGLRNDLPQRQLPSGQRARGLVAFRVPESATGLALHYSAESGDASAVFPLEG